jgi:hypothetical protein
MKKPVISINPLAEYLEATAARRNRILEEQINPDPIKLPWYQLAKARMKLSIKKNGAHAPIDNGIKELQQRQPDKKWKEINIKNSILALTNFKEMILPDLIKDNSLEIVKADQKYLNLYGVHIIIAPNILFRITIDNNKYLGAVKFHISKEKKFSVNQSKLVASLIYQYLSNVVAEEDDIVLPELCLCMDAFAKTTVNSFTRIKYDMSQIKKACDEILKLVRAA